MTLPFDRMLQRFRRASAAQGRRGPPSPTATRAFLILDRQTADGAGDAERLVAVIERALQVTAPALAMILHPAPIALADPLTRAGEARHVFHVDAALAGVARRTGDVIAVQAAVVPGATVLRFLPGGGAGAQAHLLAPPLEGLCSLRAPLGEEDARLAAAALACHALAGAAEPDATAPAHLVDLAGGLTAALDGMAAHGARSGDAMRQSECRLLAAWSGLWRGLALADPAQISRALGAILRLRRDPAADLTHREALQLDAMAGLASLALGGEADAPRRITAGITATERARMALADGSDPALRNALDGLLGELLLACRYGDAPGRKRARELLASAAESPYAGARRTYWQRLADADPPPADPPTPPARLLEATRPLRAGPGPTPDETEVRVVRLRPEPDPGKART